MRVFKHKAAAALSRNQRRAEHHSLLLKPCKLPGVLAVLNPGPLEAKVPLKAGMMQRCV